MNKIHSVRKTVTIKRICAWMSECVCVCVLFPRRLPQAVVGVDAYPDSDWFLIMVWCSTFQTSTQMPSSVASCFTVRQVNFRPSQGDEKRIETATVIVTLQPDK